jgi:uncharacterized protein YbcC (UPF0753/DUF2309 family)
MSHLSYPHFDTDLHWISQYLPHQGTLQHFVHHNTLAAFEDMPFEEACGIAEKLYQGRCYLEQDRYLNYLKVGKISLSALQSQLRETLVNQGCEPPSAVFESLLQILQQPPALSARPLIQKRLEQDPRSGFIQALRAQIEALNLAPAPPNPFYTPTYRDLILKEKGIDIDEAINPFLAKFLSAYADPGSTYWKMEGREQGVWACFRHHFHATYLLEHHLANQISQELKMLPEQDVPSLNAYYCRRLGLLEGERKTYLLAMALRLRGWAAFFNQLAHEPEQKLDQTEYHLQEFLLIKLVVEFVVCQQQGMKFPYNALKAYADQQRAQEQVDIQTELLFLVLHYQEQQGIPLELEPQRLRELSCLTRAHRLRLYQNALEQTYAEQQLHHLQTTMALPDAPAPSGAFDYITCLDDREESLRRHIEALEPTCRTFGVAGHFGLNMHFRGFNDVRYRKLCPGVIQETFKVMQVEVEPRTSRLSRVYARLAHAYHLHSKISLFAGLITFLTGIFSLAPFFTKVFFPSLDLKVRRASGHWLLRRKRFRDLIFKHQGNPEGITVEQGADKVYQVLNMIGLTQDFSPLVYVVGHGSSSINNPHEYAYNCGACGGGKGRANARIFAEIANYPPVRTYLRAKYDLSIPPDTVFIGGYHDTCKDLLTWSETALSPAQQAMYVAHQKCFEQALHYNAHERAQKFYNVPASLTPEQAHMRVLIRANDLTEARPEYNHASNALCIIGRRALTRQGSFERRSFLCSYDPTQDDGTVLASLIGAAVPVSAGINLEYYFSTVDNEVYGCGSKLNHNIINNYAVMSGFASDLRLGLSKQMVEIHDPQRLMVVVESKPEILDKIMRQNRQIERLVANQWVHLWVYDYEQKLFYRYARGQFLAVEPGAFPFASDTTLAVVHEVPHV